MDLISNIVLKLILKRSIHSHQGFISKYSHSLIKKTKSNLVSRPPLQTDYTHIIISNAIMSSDSDNQMYQDDDDESSFDALISGGYQSKSKSRSRRSSSKAPVYKDSSSEEEYNDESEDSDDSDVEIIDSDEEDKKIPAKKKKKAPPPKSSAKKTSAPKKKSPAPIKPQTNKSPPRKKVLLTLDDSDDGDKKTSSSAAASSSNATKSKTKAKSNNVASQNENEGIEVIIPHALLNKHQGTGKNECTMLVQVNESNDEKTSHHLDFHGQSGAIGRFEADSDGVILDLKGYQYRGVIRPGPTAMIVALNRDGKFKVEAITDEFVTLDTNTKTDVMAKLDAVVKGDMDESYMYQEVNVNRKKKGKDDEEDGNSTKKTGKKRAASSGGGKGNATKKRKVK